MSTKQPLFITCFSITTAIQALLFFACKSQPVQHLNLIETNAKKELGAGFRIEYNESKTYALCQQPYAVDHPNRKLKYLVMRVSDAAVVQQGSYQQGNAKWSTDDSIEIETNDGVAPTPTRQIIVIKQTDNKQ
jgi:hypothetical protein